MRQEPQHRDYRRVILLEAMSSSRSSAPDRVYVSTRVLLPVRVALRVLFRRVFTVPRPSGSSCRLFPAAVRLPTLLLHVARPASFPSSRLPFRSSHLRVSRTRACPARPPLVQTTLLTAPNQSNASSPAACCPRPAPHPPEPPLPGRCCFAPPLWLHAHEPYAPCQRHTRGTARRLPRPAHLARAALCARCCCPPPSLRASHALQCCVASPRPPPPRPCALPRPLQTPQNPQAPPGRPPSRRPDRSPPLVSGFATPPRCCAICLIRRARASRAMCINFPGVPCNLAARTSMSTESGAGHVPKPYLRPNLPSTTPNKYPLRGDSPPNPGQ